MWLRFRLKKKKKMFFIDKRRIYFYIIYVWVMLNSWTFKLNDNDNDALDIRAKCENKLFHIIQYLEMSSYNINR